MTTNAARGKVRVREGGGVEISAYAGVNPATGREQRLYENLQAGTPDREVGRRLTALVTRADELAELRRRRRKDGQAERIEPVRRERTVGNALEAWWDAQGRDLASADYGRMVIDSYLVPALGDVALWRLRGALDVGDAALDPDLVDLTAFCRSLLADGAVRARPGGGRCLEASTVHRVHGILRTALSYAVRRGWLPANPASDVRLPRVEDRESTTPEPDEANAFLRFVAPRHHDLYTFTLLVASGPRPQEIAAVRWPAIDFATGRLSLAGEGVTRTKQPGKPERWAVRRGETAKRRKRTIALDDVTLDALAQLRRRNAERALQCGVALSRRAFVFSNDPAGGDPVSPHALTAAFRRAVRSARAAHIDVPAEMRPYDYRHFGITQLLRAGRSVADVAQRFGTSSRVIQARYNHAVPSDDGRMADTMAAIWDDIRHGDADVVDLIDRSAGTGSGTRVSPRR